MSKMYVVCLLIFSAALNSADGIAKAEINRDNVVLRDGPGTNYSVVSILKIGSEVRIVKRSNIIDDVGGAKHYWIKVVVQGAKEGWVFGKYIGSMHDFTWYTFSTNQKIIAQLYRDWTILVNEESTEAVGRYSFSLPAIWNVVGNKICHMQVDPEEGEEMFLYPGLFQPNTDRFVYNTNKLGRSEILKLIYIRSVKHPLGLTCFKVLEERRDVVNGGGAGYLYSYFVQGKERYFSFGYVAPFPDDKKEALVDKIISTFRFE